MPVVVAAREETRHLRGAARRTGKRIDVPVTAQRCGQCRTRPVQGWVQGIGPCCQRCADAICGLDNR